MRYINKLVPQTLFVRFLMIITVPTIIAQLIAVYLFYDRHWYNVSHYTGDMISNQIGILLDKIDSGRIEDAKFLEASLKMQYTIFPNVEFYQKTVPSDEELSILKEILEDKLHSQVNVFFSENHTKIIAELPTPNGVVNVQFSSKLLVNPTADIFALWMILLTIALITTSVIFSKNQIRSILSLAHAADQFGKGEECEEYFKPSGAREIRVAGMALIRMRDRLRKQIKKRTQMLAMISHDLRTPLTRMKLQLELMDKSPDVKEMSRDVSSMEHMISSYLDFARGEGGEESGPVYAQKWLREAVNELAPKDLKIQFGKMNQKVLISIKPQTFKRAIANILSNSSKYGTVVLISVYKKNNDIMIEFEDNGPGIQDEEKNLVLKAFYRSDKSRNDGDRSGSVGLGLAITREIIRGHNGYISLHNGQNLGGLLVRISLPSGKRN